MRQKIFATLAETREDTFRLLLTLPVSSGQRCGELRSKGRSLQNKKADMKTIKIQTFKGRSRKTYPEVMDEIINKIDIANWKMQISPRGYFSRQVRKEMQDARFPSTKYYTVKY